MTTPPTLSEDQSRQVADHLAHAHAILTTAPALAELASGIEKVRQAFAPPAPADGTAAVAQRYPRLSGHLAEHRQQVLQMIDVAEKEVARHEGAAADAEFRLHGLRAELEEINTFLASRPKGDA